MLKLNKVLAQKKAETLQGERAITVGVIRGEPRATRLDIHELWTTAVIVPTRKLVSLIIQNVPEIMQSCEYRTVCLNISI